MTTVLVILTLFSITIGYINHYNNIERNEHLLKRNQILEKENNALRKSHAEKWLDNLPEENKKEDKDDLNKNRFSDI